MEFGLGFGLGICRVGLGSRSGIGSEVILGMDIGGVVISLFTMCRLLVGSLIYYHICGPRVHNLMRCSLEATKTWCTCRVVVYKTVV